MRDITALEAWARLDDPGYSIWRTVSEWVGGLAVAPWQAPSIPFPELSDLPRYEIRSAEVPESGGVEVFCRHEYDGEAVDLIWVGSPEWVTGPREASRSFATRVSSVSVTGTTVVAPIESSRRARRGSPYPATRAPIAVQLSTRRPGRADSPPSVAPLFPSPSAGVGSARR